MTLESHFIPQTASDALVPETCALLMWDLQEGLGGKASNRQELEPKWQELLHAAHAAGVLVVWSRHIAPPTNLMSDPEIWRIMRRQGVSSLDQLKPYMQPGSTDTHFLEGLEPGAQDLVVEKATPSLFVNTPADARLRAAGIRTIAMVGVATDIGIEFTARHALALGYFPVVISDGVGAYTAAANERSLAVLQALVLVADSSAVLGAWSGAGAAQSSKAVLA